MNDAEPLVRGVSDTALWVAYFRAKETQRSDAVFRDPFAERLAGERGVHIANTLPQGNTQEWAWVARTHLFDMFLSREIEAGADMVVNLAAGLDARPYRMQVPKTLQWVEVDLPEIISYKQGVLGEVEPRCRLERMALDLSDAVRRQELFADLGRRAKRIVVASEGLLIYFTPQEVGALARDLAATKNIDSWIIDLASPGQLRIMQRTTGKKLREAGAAFKFGPPEGENFFRPYGWTPRDVRGLLQTAADLNRAPHELMSLLPEPTGAKRDCQARVSRRIFLSTGWNVTRPAPSPIPDQVAEIWKHVLGLSSVRLDDDFFDLGGDLASAEKLFQEINRALGRKLPTVTIYRARTIASLAALLEQSSPSGFPPLATLRTGSLLPPVFITHGIGGDVSNFFHVAKHIESQHPIIGMQARGIDGVDTPFDRIEDLAAYFLGAVRRVQPHGPYALIGYSLGGLVTLEMAGRLAESGERIALLAMLETYPHKRFLSTGQKALLSMRLAKLRVSNLAKMPFREKLSYILTRVGGWIGTPGSAGAHESVQDLQSSNSVAELMRSSANKAWMHYRPRRYNGKIQFIRAKVNAYFPNNPGVVWRRVAREVQVEDVPGDHAGILTTYFKDLAAVLSRHLKALSC